AGVARGAPARARAPGRGPRGELDRGREDLRGCGARARRRRDRVARRGPGARERTSGGEGDVNDVVARVEEDDRARDGGTSALCRWNEAADGVHGRGRAASRHRDGGEDAVLQPAEKDRNAATVIFRLKPEATNFIGGSQLRLCGFRLTFTTSRLSVLWLPPSGGRSLMKLDDEA